MASTVFIPALMRKLSAGKDRTTATGATLRAVVDDLDRQFPGFRDRVVEDNDLSGSVAVSVNGEIITGGLSEAIPADSEIHFLPAIGGG